MDFANITPPHSPSSWLDLEALNHNIKLVNTKTKAVSLRLATKSLRSIKVLQYIAKRSPNFIGLMSYAANESVYLLQNDFDNILCAYPTLDMVSVAKTFEFTQKGAVMIWMVDSFEQVNLLNITAKNYNTKVKVCFDINMSMPLPKLYFGTKRSSILYKKQLKKLVTQISKLPHVNIEGIMGYEAQIAGLAERSPDRKRLTPVIRLLKSRSKKQVSQRRKSVVTWMHKQGYELALVNGGGSGSIDFTASQSEVTEVTVGSAYYKPAYFDYMDSMQDFLPAAGFVLPVTRQPEKQIITCQGGGFIASGAMSEDKRPVVHYPTNLSILADEGFGEVQTPMKAVHGNVPTIGEAVWCRHAKAGELCEHFNALVCYQNDSVLNKTSKAVTMTTYRGDGKCFH